MWASFLVPTSNQEQTYFVYETDHGSLLIVNFIQDLVQDVNSIKINSLLQGF